MATMNQGQCWTCGHELQLTGEQSRMYTPNGLVLTPSVPTGMDLYSQQNVLYVEYIVCSAVLCGACLRTFDNFLWPRKLH